MLPRLDLQTDIDPIVAKYLKELDLCGFTGDIESNYSSRLAVATDNSVYQQLPQAVLLPKSTKDVALITRISAQTQFEAIRFSARGGGTGTNGQSLTPGIIVDLSRHMNKVLEINVQEGWVRVQTGVIKDQLNDAVREHGFFFSPDLSTSNRATIGGMVNTDASGQGSLKYGKTSDHVLSLEAVFADGSIYESDGSKGQPSPHTYSQVAVETTKQVCIENRDEIVNKFPPLNRFLTGYDLKNTISEQGEFDFTRILCGSEGSLAILTEAKLNLTPIPKSRVLINIKYDSFDAALRHAPLMVEANALSVETIDSKVLNLAKQDMVWNTVSELLQDVPDKEMLGINMVEYADQNADLVNRHVSSLTTILDGLIAQQQSGVIGYQVCTELAGIQKIYNMRKKAVGLLGATDGAKKPLAFAEDTCVPPENLADFIAEFRELLDSHDLHYGMFGHVDAGVLHVRPALDMCDPQQELLMHKLSDQVVALVAKYKGLMWGEHGKGYRSEYGPEFFGDKLFTELRRIKSAFDPLNKMNPGKICTPLDSQSELVKVSDTKRGYYDRQIPVVVRDSFKEAMECNGNGLCFNYDTSSPMCPSMKVLADRRHSPKGRAGVVREWLRQLSEQGIDVLDLEHQVLKGEKPLRSLMQRVSNTLAAKNKTDFSHEVFEVMSGCLACKACASQCPIKVDVPSFRSRFFNIYYSRYQRPLKDYFVANIESMLPLMAISPAIVNGVLSSKFVQAALKSTIGYVDAPLLSTPLLKTRIGLLKLIEYDYAKLSRMSEADKAKSVLIVQDPFTSFYDAQVVEEFAQLAIKLGYTPILLPFKPNGKAQHIKGFMKQFSTTAKNTADFLTQVSGLGIDMVGVDPALVLCYRDEYEELLGEKATQFEVKTVHEWLLPVVDKDKTDYPLVDIEWKLFAHCTEKTKLPNAEKEWGQIFKHFGAKLTAVPVGCCGMAGTFGHELTSFEMSKDIYELSWKQRFEQNEISNCLVTGYSCRSQVKRFENQVTKHPLQALNAMLSQ